MKFQTNAQLVRSISCATGNIRNMTCYTYPVTNILRTISDDYSLALFNAVAMGNHDVNSLKATSNLSTKQYYSRIAALSKSYVT